MNSLVLTELVGQTAILTLNRPERHNSLVPELLDGLLGALAGFQENGDLRAVILQANGRSFSTGGDVQAFYDHRDRLGEYTEHLVGLLNRAILALVALPVPVIAAVQGIVTGGSIGLVAASDVVIVAPDATFAPYYATVGFSPDGGWTALLPDLIGRRRAEEILILDRAIDAERAVAWGLANRIVAASQIRAEALAIARDLAGRKPGSIHRIKRLLWQDRERVAARLEHEREEFVKQIATPEAVEGMTAFLRRNN